jgi:hypothetical protein
MIDFLEGDDDFGRMGMGFEDFDFSMGMEFPLVSPMPASSALSF